MKKFLLGIITLVAVALCSSCTTTQYVARQDSLSKLLVGEDHHAVVSILGTPSRYAADGRGGTILIYDKSTYYNISQARDSYHHSSAYGSKSLENTYTNYINVYTDSNGICYDVRSDLMREEKKIAPFKTSMLILAILIGGIAIAG